MDAGPSAAVLFQKYIIVTFFENNSNLMNSDFGSFPRYRLFKVCGPVHVDIPPVRGPRWPRHRRLSSTHPSPSDYRPSVRSSTSPPPCPASLQSPRIQAARAAGSSMTCSIAQAGTATARSPADRAAFTRTRAQWGNVEPRTSPGRHTATSRASEPASPADAAGNACSSRLVGLLLCAAGGRPDP